MREPWFQLVGALRYRSLSWRGRVLRLVTYLGLFCFLMGAFNFADSDSGDSGVWWAIGVLGFGVCVTGYAMIGWKMDWDGTSANIEESSRQAKG